MTVDELTGVGMETMDDAQIRDALESEGVGVLGLATGDEPYMVPMSFDFDGDSHLYFTFLLGADSRKAELCEQNDTARFLVYSAEGRFNWLSVLVTGTITDVPADEWDEIEDSLDNAWRPETFREGQYTADVELYQLRIEHQQGIMQSGVWSGP